MKAFKIRAKLHEISEASVWIDAETYENAMDILNDGEFNWDDVRREFQEEFRFDDFVLESKIELCFCKFCKERGTPGIMKKHDHGFVCPSCWDERLRCTE